MTESARRKKLARLAGRRRVVPLSLRAAREPAKTASANTSIAARAAASGAYNQEKIRQKIDTLLSVMDWASSQVHVLTRMLQDSEAHDLL